MGTIGITVGPHGRCSATRCTGLAGRKRFEEDFVWENVLERYFRPLVAEWGIVASAWARWCVRNAYVSAWPECRTVRGGEQSCSQPRVSWTADGRFYSVC